MKRTTIMAAIMAALIGFGSTANAQNATKAVAVNNGAPVKVYWPLAGEYLVLSEDIKLWQYVNTNYTDANDNQVPEAIRELSVESQRSVKSITALFASTARFAGTKKKEFSEQLSLLIGFEDAMKQLGCSRSNEAKLASATSAAAEAQTAAADAKKPVDEFQAKIDAIKGDPQVAKVESLRKEIEDLKKTIALRRPPRGTPRAQFNAAKSAAKESLKAKEPELKAEEAKLAELNKPLTDLEQKLEAAKAELKTKSDASVKAETEYDAAVKDTAWTCKFNADQEMLSKVEAFIGGTTVSKPEYAAAAPFIKKAKESSDSSLRALNVWTAISRLRPTAISFLTTPSDLGVKGLAKETNVANIPEGDIRINLNPYGAAVDVTSNPGDRTYALEPSLLEMLGLNGDSMIGSRLLNKSRTPWWNKNVPPLRLMLNTSLFSGSSVDTRHNRDFDVSAVGYGISGTLGVEGVLKRWRKSTAFLYGLDLGVGYRKTSFRDETLADPAKHSSVFFSADARLGVNIRDWTSVYVLGGLRLPLGSVVGGGLELTGFGPARVAVEGLYDLNRDRANTGVAGSHPADFSGASLRLKAGVVF